MRQRVYPGNVTRRWNTLLILGLAACSGPTPAGEMATRMLPPSLSLPDLGAAPELHNAVWFNTDSPLTLGALRGKVVALEMWTFGCVNCRNVIPYLKQWHADYKDLGLVLIANHFPEFSYERDLDNLRAAVAQAGIECAVAQDEDGATWNAYHNRYWPTLYLIDKRGHIRYVHVGEGAYAETGRNVQALLAEPYP